MRNIKNNILSIVKSFIVLLTLMLNIGVFAQSAGGPPTVAPPTGGAGGKGPGRPSKTPIDTHLVGLGAIAVVMLSAYAARYRRKVS